MTQPRTPAEQYVVDRVQAGVIADLAIEQFPEEKDRELRASFLEALLTDELDGVMVTRKGVLIKNAIFTELIELVNAEIRHATWLNYCDFRADVFLVAAHFHSILSIEGSTFHQIASFAGLDISGHLNADGTEFDNTKEGASFNGMKVGQTASFKGAKFAAAADFLAVEISGEFHADDIHFSNTQEEANFSSMKVGRAAYFKKAIFAGEVRFSSAEIAGQFNANDAQFTNVKEEANFNGMKVDQIAFFRGVTFAGPVLMADADFLYLGIEDARSGDESEKNIRLDLSRTVVKRELLIQNTKFESLVATQLQVDGAADFHKVTIENEVNLEHSRFVRLKFSDVTWPDKPDSVRLEGMKYEHIEADDGAESWEKLLEMAEGARYNVSVYSNLEEFFKQQGLGEQANKVFVARKRRERRRIPRRAIHRKFWQYFLDYSVRYGRSPARALVWGAAIICVGYCVFYSQYDMVLQDSKKAFTTYSPFWYSFDLFVPFIDLKAASLWVPVPDDCLGWFWMRIQQILGWVLIPTGLAAWMGMIK